MASGADILAGLGGTLVVRGNRKPYIRHPATDPYMRPDFLTKTLAAAPTWPDPGTYDPTYDINKQNAGIGYDRLKSDTIGNYGEALGGGNLLGGAYGTQSFNDAVAGGARAPTDLATALGQIGTNRDRIGQDYGTAVSNIDLGVARNNEDYNTATRNLSQQYQRLGSSQGQAANAAGVGLGGAMLQAAQKRAANQTQDQTGLNVAKTRYDENAVAQRGALDTNVNRSLADLLGSSNQATQTYERGRQDAFTGLARGGEDNTRYGNDLGRLAYYSTGQAQPDTLAQALGNVKVTGHGTFRKTASGKWLKIG